jgi:hypothetical protein
MTAFEKISRSRKETWSSCLLSTRATAVMMRSREGLRVRESDSVIVSSVSMYTTCLVFWKSAVTLCAPVQIEQVSLKYSIKFHSLPSTSGIDSERLVVSIMAPCVSLRYELSKQFTYVVKVYQRYIMRNKIKTVCTSGNRGQVVVLPTFAIKANVWGTVV